MSEVSRRRTFAIIAHPDAGKTTLTEKFLLFGGAIQLAGEVKAKKNKAQTRSDWMKIEQERGISVVTSVMTFEYKNCILNLLDTPGHEDFSDDTYRTLTAVDSAVMVLDGARGIEPRTLKLFEVCRLRNIPIITFINKMDREAQDPLQLLDEIENKLALDTAPMNWPIASGQFFSGIFDFKNNRFRQEDTKENWSGVSGIDDPILKKMLPLDLYLNWVENVSLAKEACRAFDHALFLQGHLSPVYFGSALRNVGVRDLIDFLIKYGPCPKGQTSSVRCIKPDESKMTGFIFKIQANMDKNHRDRIAFMRICSGTLRRGMKAYVVRNKKTMTLSAPQFFFARSRHVADCAHAGDIVGIPNHGSLRIGDSLTEGEDLRFEGIPNFAPEILRRVRISDAIKAKKLNLALLQMAEEGVVQLFSPEDGSPAIIGVIGALQLDVLKQRLEIEYDLKADFELSRFQICRWISAKDLKELELFKSAHGSDIAYDLDGRPVFLAPNLFSLNYELERFKNILFSSIKTYQNN